MRGVSRKSWRGFPPFFMGVRVKNYESKIHLNQNALKQLDELIRHFRSEGEVSCAVAEREDQNLDPPCRFETGFAS